MAEEKRRWETGARLVLRNVEGNHVGYEWLEQSLATGECSRESSARVVKGV